MSGERVEKKGVLDGLSPPIRRAVAESFLGEFAPERVEPLLARGAEVDVPPRVVMPPSSYQNFSALIADGLARLYVTGPKGREVTLGYLRRGRLIFTILPGLPASLRIQAITACKGFLIPSEDARAWLASHADFGNAVTAYMLSLIYEAINDYRFSTFATVRQRVARHLVEIGSVADGLMPMSARELADTVGSVREVVARVVRELERERMVESGPKGVRIVDRDHLIAEYSALLSGS
jgi:CRP/FNR family cyclic AMP-dependent transcriptional regulator